MNGSDCCTSMEMYLILHYCKLQSVKIVSVLLRGASLIAQLVKNLPAMKETPVQFLEQEDLLDKG